MFPTPPSISLIVATRDRPGAVRNLLRSLAEQTSPPERIILVDSGTAHVEDVVSGFPSLSCRVVRSRVASASGQRNMGIEAIDTRPDLVAFSDDDVVFEPEAFRAIRDFWMSAVDEVGGVGFNLVNHPRLQFSFLKRLPFARRLQLYSPEPGVVLRSGIHTLIGEAATDLSVDWLPTTAVTWRAEILSSFRFDEWFSGYSYLEDLDFSYRVGKRFRLRVAAAAGYRHHPAPNGRGSGVEFGRREVLNRIHFVRKHTELSRGYCFLALLLRTLISFGNAVAHGSAYDLGRVVGNIRGLWESLWT